MTKTFSRTLAAALVLTLAACTANLTQDGNNNGSQDTNTDISAVLTQISGINAALDQLRQSVASLSQSITALEGADASLQASLQAQKEALEGQIAALRTYVDQVTASEGESAHFATTEQLDELTATVTELSWTVAAVSAEMDAIKTETLAKLTQDVAALTEVVSGILSRLDGIERQLAAVISAVQSVVAVPDLSDGSVMMTGGESNVIRFEVYPLDAAAKLAGSGVSALSLDFVETKAGALNRIPLTAVSFDGEFLSVVADGSSLSQDYISGKKSINARLRISDGTVTRSSEYFRLAFSTAPKPEVTIELLPVTDMVGNYPYYQVTVNARMTIARTENDRVKCGFAVDQYKDNLWTLYNSCTPSEDGTFSITRNGLLPNTTYYYRAIVVKNNLYYYSDLGSFETGDQFSKMTVNASLPEPNYDCPWIWKDGDALDITAGGVTAKYEMTYYSAIYASFEGDYVGGDSYTIQYPSGDLSQVRLDRQTQRGNNNTDHLQHFALLSGVDDCSEIGFSSSWAQNHGGSLKQNGILRLQLQMPDAVTTVDKVSVRAAEKIFHVSFADDALSDELILTLEDCQVDDNHRLYAWITLSWYNDILPAGVQLTFSVDAGGQKYSKTVSRSSTFTFGHEPYDNIGLNSSNWEVSAAD